MWYDRVGKKARREKACRALVSSFRLNIERKTDCQQSNTAGLQCFPQIMFRPVRPPSSRFWRKSSDKKNSLVLVPPTKASFHWPTDHGKSMSFLTFEACRASIFFLLRFWGLTPRPHSQYPPLNAVTRIQIFHKNNLKLATQLMEGES